MPFGASAFLLGSGSAQAQPVAFGVVPNSASNQILALPSSVRIGDVLLAHMPFDENSQLDSAMERMGWLRLGSFAWQYTSSKVFWRPILNTTDSIVFRASQYGYAWGIYRNVLTVADVVDVYQSPMTADFIDVAWPAKVQGTVGLVAMMADRDTGPASPTNPNYMTRLQAPVGAQFAGTIADRLAVPAGSHTDKFTGFLSTFGQVARGIELRGRTGVPYDVTDPPDMTFYASPPGYQASASTEYGANDTGAPYHAFSSSGYAWAAATDQAWLQVRFPTERKVTAYQIQGASTAKFGPTSFSLLGSVDGRNWTTLDNRIGEASWTSNEEREYEIAAPVPGFYLRLLITDNSDYPVGSEPVAVMIKHLTFTYDDGTTIPFPVDIQPEAFAFVDKAGAAVSTVYTSAAITVDGIEAASPITVSGGQYNVNGGAFTSSPGTVNQGDLVCARGTSAAGFGESVGVTVSIGGVSDTFLITTEGVDATPDAFSFTDVTNAVRSTEYESNAITVTGVNSPAAVSISAGQYSKNGAAYTSAPGTAVNGDIFKVKLMSSGSFGTSLGISLTIGGVSDTFTVETGNAAPTVRRVLTPVGDSWTRGNEQEISRLGTGNVTPTDRWTNKVAASLSTTEYMTPGQTGVTNGVIVAGYGGQTTATIRTNLAALIAADPLRAQDAAIIGPGKNDTGNSTGYSDVLTGVDAILAMFPHDRKVVWGPYGAQGGIGLSSASIGSWVRSKRLRWAYRDDTRRKYFFELDRYYQGLSPNGSSGTTADNLAAAEDSLIASIRASAATDQQHPNYIAASLWEPPMTRVAKAMWNEGVEAMDATIKVPFDCAAGTKIKVFFKGYVTGFSVTQDDPSPGLWAAAGMVSGKSDEGYLERTSVSPGNLTSIVNMQITAVGVDKAGAPVSDVADIRIVPSLEGSGSTIPKGVTLPRDTHATATSRRWPYVAFESSPWASAGTKFSYAAWLKVGEDGTTMTLWSAGSTRVLIQRTTGNRFVIRLQDNTGADIMNWTTVTSLFNIAAGAFWLFVDIDMNGGSPVAHVWANIGGADVNIAPATALNAQNGALSLTSLPLMFNVTNAQVTWKGSVGMIWAADDVLASGGFSNVTNRRLFCSLAGAPVDLGSAGVVGGITPEVYLPGGPGDWLSGKNFGSGPQFGFNDNWLRGFTGNSSDPLPF